MKFYRILNPDGSAHSPETDNFDGVVNMVNFFNKNLIRRNPDTTKLFSIEEGTLQWKPCVTEDLLTLEELKEDE